MKIIKLNLSKRSYQIVIGNKSIAGLGIFLKKLDLGHAAYVITNRALKAKFGLKLSGALKPCGLLMKFKLVPDSEKSKSITIASKVITDIARFGKMKKIFIIALGGGVVGDLAGFIASVYKRGSNYIQVPTTLLAQVDSSIGGKTALDLMEAKNLIGAFHQPRLVFVDTSFLKSLDLRQLRSGLAEVVKYGVIKDAQLFSYLENNWHKIITRKAGLDFIVWRSALIKAKIVEKDEREEKGLRTVLNFGHTIGHAIEAASDYSGYTHGEAVALGMLVAADISRDLGFLKEKTLERIERLLKNIGLPTVIEQVLPEKIIRAQFHDKKFSGAKNKLVLLKDIGKVLVVKDVPLAVIKEAVRRRIA